MGIRRPEKLEEVRGQDKLIQYGSTKINQGIFPQVTLWTGDEGLGKTTLAILFGMAIHCEGIYKPCYECPTCKAITQRVIRDEKDNEYISVFNASIDGGKEAVTQALAALNTSFSPNGKKVVIVDECHRMSDDAQDMLNKPLEKLPKGVYIMFLTTDPLRMSKAILSRFVQFNLRRPSRKEMIEVLKADAKRRGLQVQGGDATFDLIALWSEDKPRAALQVLEAMGENCDVTTNDIKDFIDVLDISTIIPLISSLNGSILIGMNTIMDLPMSRKTHNQLIEVLVEAIKLKENKMSYRVGNEDLKLLRAAVDEVDMDRLVTFLYNVSSLPSLSKRTLIAAYLKNHPYITNVTQHKPEILDEELAVKAQNNPDYESHPERPIVPSMSELINKGTVIEK